MKRYKKIFYTFILLFVILLFLIIANTYFGWYGYKKWEPRRSTFGKVEESKNRGVFVKKISYKKEKKDNIEFDLYIEKGFRYGIHSSSDTRIIEDSEYLYQLPKPIDVLPDDIAFVILNSTSFDSIFNHNILLEKPQIKDTIIIELRKFDTIRRKWNSINSIKAWE